MNITSILASEHPWIWHFARALSRGRLSLRMGMRPPREFFEGAVEFGQAFVLDYHGQRQQWLAAALRESPATVELTPTLDVGRRSLASSQQLLHSLSWRAAHLDDWRPMDSDASIDILGNLASCLIATSNTEECRVYPEVHRVLGHAEQTRLLRQFQDHDRLVGPSRLVDLRELSLFLAELFPQRMVEMFQDEAVATIKSAG
jgi:hypothetical protein